MHFERLLTQTISFRIITHATTLKARRKAGHTSLESQANFAYRCRS